ncbi:MAG: RHS repeat-associated core domain-containing protein, partial [Clostridia bacterium]|nr:RHS repeat-associated core domain-containing protein [Clostridia bacterium]
YDDNGNMLEKRLTPFVDSTAQTQIVKLTNVYDRFNQLTMSITDDGKTVCNTYNGEGLRIRKDVNGVATNYLYEGMKVVAEYDGEYNLGAQNVQGLNLLMRVEQNATYYYMYNGHADVTALLSAQTGNIDATYYYDAFGTVLSQTGNVSNSYLYAGYQYDEETGLYYLNARMYDSETARFVQEDTYRGNPNDPLSLNLYTYCANNPLKYEDPSGHSWISTKFNNLKKSVSKKIETAKKVVKSVVNTVKTKITNSSTYKKAAEFYNKHEQTIKKVAIVTATVAAIALGVTATVATGGLAGAVIGGALTGMGMGIGITGVSDYMDDHKINKSMNEYLANAGGGAIAGGILGAGGFMMAEGVMANTLASTMTLGGTSAMAGNMTTQFMGKGSIDPVQALEAGIIGAATAGLFYGVSKIVGGITNSITSKGNSQNANTAQLNDGIVKSGSELGKLKSIGNGAWESTEGLIYEQGSKQGNRVLHVLEHTVPDPSKPLHSVFNAGRDKVLGVVDEAWSMRNSVTPILQKNGNQVFDIPMSKIIGTNGETTIRIVVENGTSKIVTSFPVK